MPQSAVGRQGIPAEQARTPQPGPYPGTVSTGQGRTARVATGSLHVPCHTRLAGLLRDAAKATELNWCEMSSQEDRDLGVPALAAALGDLHIFCTRLSACSRLHAMNEPTPHAFARAALVHGASCFLHQAWFVLSDTGTSVTGHVWQSPLAAPIEQAARDSVAQWQPAATVDQQALELLADAMGALARGVGALVGHAAQPLGAVHACVSAAAGQLRAACEPAPPAGRGPAASVAHAGTS